MRDFITTHQDGSVTVSLVKGITVSGAHSKTLTMREPTVADQIAAQHHSKQATEQEVWLIASLAMVAPDDIKALSLRDYRRVQEALMGFAD